MAGAELATSGDLRPGSFCGVPLNRASGSQPAHFCWGFNLWKLGIPWKWQSNFGLEYPTPPKKKHCFSRVSRGQDVRFVFALPHSTAAQSVWSCQCLAATSQRRHHPHLHLYTNSNSRHVRRHVRHVSGNPVVRGAEGLAIVKTEVAEQSGLNS